MYKKNICIITTPISKECNEKLGRLVIDLRYKSKAQLQKDILENSVNAIYEMVYNKKEEMEDGDFTE